jgi:hypothetical protein
MKTLDRMGHPWISRDSRARAAPHADHPPGYPSAWKCGQCQEALYQQVSRVLKKLRTLRDDPRARRAWDAYRRERAEAEAQAGARAAAEAKHARQEYAARLFEETNEP